MDANKPLANMNTKTVTCTGTIHKDKDGKWFVNSQLRNSIPFDSKLKCRPDPSVEDGTDVEVELTGAGICWTVTSYRFI